MKKTLFLGSSHVGAYKSAAKSNPDMFSDIAFVGIPRVRFSKGTIKDQFLTFKNLPDAVKMFSTGRQLGNHFEIDLCAYNNIVLLEGINPLSPELYSCNDSFSPLSGKLVSKILDNILLGDCLAKVNNNQAEAINISNNLINRISSLSVSCHLKSIRVPSPLPSERIPLHASSKFTRKELLIYLRDKISEDAASNLHMQLTSFENIALKIYTYVNARNTPSESVVLPPKHLLTPGFCRTSKHWFSGSVDVAGNEKESLKQNNDFYHVNRQYAIEMMQSISNFLNY